MSATLTRGSSRERPRRAPHLDREGMQGGRVTLWSPHDLRHCRISLLHLRGVRWARIAEFVGQRDLTVTANTYTHVLSGETELDYAKLVA
jgi:integrase